MQQIYAVYEQQAEQHHTQSCTMPCLGTQVRVYDLALARSIYGRCRTARPVLISLLAPEYFCNIFALTILRVDGSGMVITSSILSRYGNKELISKQLA